MAKHLGATTVGISAVPHAPLATVADHYLAVLSPELARSGTFIVASGALMLVADLIAAAVAEDQDEQLTQRRSQVSEWIESRLRVGPLDIRSTTPDVNHEKGNRQMISGTEDVRCL